jgi:S-ribosylhomocysteine lyase LuxS involved in autoinducer biosynthesis
LEAKAMEYKPETKTVSFKSTPYHFSKERENKHYTCRLMDVEEYAVLADNPIEHVEIHCTNSKEKISREVIDITPMGYMLGKLLIGIGWKAPEEVV